MIKNIVFAGSGLDGTAYIGVIQRLEEMKMVDDIAFFAGASSGAFIATMMALGYSARKLMVLLETIKLSELIDPWYKQIYNFFTKWGGSSTKQMRAKLASCFEQIGVNPEITFSELCRTKQNFVTIVVTDVVNRTPLYVNAFTQPYASILDTLVSSLSVPFIFAPNKETLWVDGGLSDNYPVWIYNDMKLLQSQKYTELKQQPVSDETLGVQIAPPTTDAEKGGLCVFIINMIKTVLANTSSYVDVDDLVIPSSSVTFSFNKVTADVIEKLVEHGYKSATDHFNS